MASIISDSVNKKIVEKLNECFPLKSITLKDNNDSLFIRGVVRAICTNTQSNLEFYYRDSRQYPEGFLKIPFGENSFIEIHQYMVFLLTDGDTYYIPYTDLLSMVDEPHEILYYVESLLASHSNNNDVA